MALGSREHWIVPRALRVAVGMGEPEELTPEPAALPAGHGTELGEHPVALAHEGLGHPHNDPVVLGHPRPARVGGQKMPGPVLPPAIVLERAGRDRKAVPGPHGEKPAVERVHRAGDVRVGHGAKDHHGAILPRRPADQVRSACPSAVPNSV